MRLTSTTASWVAWMRGRIALALAMAGVLIASCSLWLDGGLDPFSLPAVIIGLGVWVLDQPR